ncbi:MAG: hypothetical protein QF475_01260 [Candidatus Undinarchaeales archaeon]|nr:hypothetical protein [Candidatus Undinarchaeales archaeon]
MPIVDLTFTKINASRKKPEKGANLNDGLKINSGTKINNIVKDKFGKLGECLLIDFSYNANYEPDLGSIEICGEVVFYEPKLTQVSDIQDGKVVLKPGTFELVQNAILSASSVESLLISREIKLPPAVQLPRVTLKPSDEVAKDNTVELKNEKEEEKKD